MSKNSTGVAYARFSHKASEDKVVTLESQLEDERKRAKNDGCKIVAEFADDGFSGWKKGVKRPGWDEMLEYVEKNNVDRIYTRETDRTSRQILQTAMLLEFCIQHGVTLVEGGNVTAPDDEDAHDMRMMKATYDKRYSSSISKKTKNAREKSALAGRSHPGQRPFGYKKDRKTLDRREAAAYVELFDRVIAGERLNAISRDWASRGILNRSGRPFTGYSLTQLLKAPRAVGLRQHRGEVLEGVKGDWKPIVSEAVQRRALKARDRHLRGPALRRADDDAVRPARLLSSLVFCGECDGPMRVRYGASETRKPQYSCNPALRDSCGHVHILAEIAEPEVEKRFLVRLLDPKTHKVLERLRKRAPDTTSILDEIDAAQTELDELAELKRSGAITVKEWITTREGAQERLDGARDRLNAVNDSPILLAMPPIKTQRMWDSFDLDEKRRHLAAWIVSVRISPLTGSGSRKRPERVVVEWRV